VERIASDLVVIGGGASGLAAAVRARELGVTDVVVLEKTPRTGGNAWLAVVMLGLGDSAQPADDMTAWRDQTFAGLMAASDWTSDPEVVGAYVDTYPRVVRWLTAKGMEFVVSGFDLGGPRFTTLAMSARKGDYKVTDPSRGPGFIGSTATDLLREDALKLGVRVLTETKVTKILLDEAEEAVRGVVATGPGGDLEISARSVVLAAGGFGANDDLLERFFPHEYRKGDQMSTLCVGSSVGDGFLLADDIGLQMGNDMSSGIMGPSHHPWSHSIHEAVHRPETLWINAAGRRFTNESLGVRAMKVLNRQPGGFLWALFDSPLKDYMIANPSARQVGMGGEDWLRTLSEDLEKEARWKRKTVAIAESWEALADKLEIEPARLQATIARYNELCAAGRDADFIKPAPFLKPLLAPPFYAVLGTRFCHGTEGGTKVNGSMQVTGRRGQRIAGLYASGDNTSGWVTHIGLPGTTLGFAFTSGYIAGEQSTAYLEA
jgi:fumarate reductase flavoprotein subunit